MAVAFAVAWRRRQPFPNAQPSPPLVDDPQAGIFVAAGLWLLPNLIAGAVAAQQGGIGKSPTPPTALLHGVALGTALVGTAFVYLRYWKSWARPAGSVPLRAFQGAAVLWIALPVIYGVSILIQFLLQKAGVLTPQSSVETLKGRAPGWEILVLHAVVGAPLVEEMAFRGALYGALRRIARPWTAALISSVLFGVVHLNVAAFVPLTVLGLFLCLLVERTGSLLPSIVAHAGFNTLTAAGILLFPPG